MVTLETVIDMMIDIPVKFLIILSITYMIMPHLYVITYTDFVLFNNTKLLFVNLYDHTLPICVTMYSFHFVQQCYFYYICKSI